jgi:arginine decarboxylase
MDTPICDFVDKYVKNDALRLHMPGHKGKTFIGCEKYDITEIDGADSLYQASGIIMRSEKNAGAVFGADTFYSAEGSSLSIKAMLHLALLFGREKGKRPLIAAGRNAHKAFINAAALLDFDIMWLTGKEEESYLSCRIDPEYLDKKISVSQIKPSAVYITSPDYLGNITDIKGLSEVCRRHGILLLVDNAHGAYLKFLKQSRHPIDLGADICCDSAHKTLPVLTGGAYLHLSHSLPGFFRQNAKQALALFGSTSPSYIILQSLDRANNYLTDGYRERLSSFIYKIRKMKECLSDCYCFSGDEDLKLTIDAKKHGYTGLSLANELAKRNIICEFADPDFTVLMLTPETGEEGLLKLKKALLDIPSKPALMSRPPAVKIPKTAVSVRSAVFSQSEIISSDQAQGRIAACADYGCPPAVPIVVSGEIIDGNVIECFNYYGIKTCSVIKEI